MKKVMPILLVLVILLVPLSGMWIGQIAAAQDPPHTMWGYVKSDNGTASVSDLTVHLYNTNKSRAYKDVTDINGIWLIDLDDYEDGNILEINSSSEKIVEVVSKSPGTQQAKDLLLKIPQEESVSMTSTPVPEQEKPKFSVFGVALAISGFFGIMAVLFLIKLR